MALRHRSLHFVLPVPLVGDDRFERAVSVVETMIPGRPLLVRQVELAAIQLDLETRGALLSGGPGSWDDVKLWSQDIMATEEANKGNDSLVADFFQMYLRPHQKEGHYAGLELELPENVETGKEAAILLLVGDALGAWWGGYSPIATALALRDCFTNHGLEKYCRALPGLPLLNRGLNLPSPEYPELLEWLNYWSPTTCALIGFPEPARDEEWLRLAVQSPASGAWLVPLTADPLDLQRPEHIAVVQRAYARFDKVGIRHQPKPSLTPA